MATAKKKEITRDAVISLYMNYVLEHDREPQSVFKFCKDQKISEEKFYHFFGSFQGLQKEIWNTFFDNALNLVQKQKGYETFENKNKMLSFFYTFFELLTANRSYVLFALDDNMNMTKNRSQLSGLRKRVKEFSSELIEDNNDEKQLKILKHPVSVFSEGAWLQTLFILKYWMEDNSAGFEKTDLVIEKSVRAIFDVFETTPLESILDFGKFLWKDKMN
ncbi:MAG: TetR/AcrR family transcriptional regulator [Flavobacteriaceae bacterium]|nr:TetR/AcrR family transcriptional regulator [Flavobacteriaceae bacterium]